MRVIAGKWKGRKLVCPKGQQVRPTTDRVKEAMFNILGARVDGARVFDLCCGTGSLGIEALSRGAAEAVFVDSSGRSLAAARANLERCGGRPGTWSLIRHDALDYMESLSGRGDRPWILVCDPPYDSDLAVGILEARGRWLEDPDFLMAVVEMGRGHPVAAPDTVALERRRYGKTVLAVVRGLEQGADHE